MEPKRIIVVAFVAVVLGLATAGAVVVAQETSAAAETERLRDEARRLGAKGQLPLAWWDLDQRFEQAQKGGADEETWATLRLDAERLRNRAAFVDEMRKRKSGMEALLGRFDQALGEIAALYGLSLDPVLTGSASAADLIARLDAENLTRQVLTDSLRVTNRRLTESVGSRFAAQDSLVIALQVEVSALRQKLWETELRAGVAEADRSAAETVLTSRQRRDDAIAQVRAGFSPAEAEILLTAEGAVVMRVHGIAFAVGSAQVRDGQGDLLARVADAIALFPAAAVRIEGHTDDTGGREANLRLSRRRAETVAVLLADQLGRAAESFTTDGYGPDRPVALNSTPEGRALNRRIDVVIAAGS